MQVHLEPAWGKRSVLETNEAVLPMERVVLANRHSVLLEAMMTNEVRLGGPHLFHESPVSTGKRGLSLIRVK